MGANDEVSRGSRVGKLSPTGELVHFCFGAPTVWRDFLRQMHSGLFD